MNIRENNKFWNILKGADLLSATDYDFWVAENQAITNPPKKQPAQTGITFAKKDKVRFLSRKNNVKVGTIVKIGKTTTGAMAAVVMLDDKKTVNVLLSDLEKLV